MQQLGRADPRRVGPYRIAARVGSGGMGQVYAARGKGGALVAVKVIHDEYAADADFRARFTREVDLIRRVASPYLPAFHGADPDAPRPWLATDYVSGLTLGQWVRQHGPVLPPLLGAFASGVARALVAIHAAGVVHRDLKPGNVVLSGSGPMVLDFGIARAVEETALTRTGLLVGTPGWISPEQYEGHPATVASDTFSWAALVVHAATGRPPFGTGDPDILAHRVATRAADLTGVPREWQSLLSAALDPDPSRRPTSQQLAQGLKGHAPAPHTWTVRPEPPRLPRRPVPRRALAVGAAATAVVLLAGSATWALLNDGAEAPPETNSAEEGTGGEESAGGEDNGDDEAEADAIDWTEVAPELAVDQAENDQGASRAQIGELSVDELAEVEDLNGIGDPDEGALVRLVDDPDQPVVMLFHEATRPNDRLFVEAVVLDMPESDDLFEDSMFGVLGPDSQETLAPHEESTYPHPENQPRTVRLTFEGAPERGLLTVGGPESSGPLQGVPTVAVCYHADAVPGDGAAGSFSTNYTNCE